ncbi:helix-turn-helix domain-containing protein [Leucobacter chromiireducens]|uniref:helix-turn-helix domain-containing protein n=1 Tax=Leucobacter chromiireducens TaxID=283877 RepID=UPI003F80CEDC
MTKSDERMRREDIEMDQQELIPAGWLTVGEASEALGVHERTIQRRIKSGEIPVFSLSPHRRFVPSGWVEALRAGQLEDLEKFFSTKTT